MENQQSILKELLIAWKWSSIALGNIMAVILLLTWWQGESWVRADNGALVEISRSMGKAVKK